MRYVEYGSIIITIWYYNHSRVTMVEVDNLVSIFAPVPLQPSWWQRPVGTGVSMAACSWGCGIWEWRGNEIPKTLDISRWNVTRYWTQYERKKVKTLFIQRTHKRRPIPRPYGRAMGRIFWIHYRKYIARHRECIPCVAIWSKERLVILDTCHYPAEDIVLLYTWCWAISYKFTCTSRDRV